MTEPTTYQTASGATVTTGSRTNAFNQTVHVYECNGCTGIRGYKTPDQAADGAMKHAKRCTGRPVNGGAR